MPEAHFMSRFNEKEIYYYAKERYFAIRFSSGKTLKNYEENL